MRIIVSAPAKVNLALRVGPPRLDGFHPLDTVFEALDVYDDVHASPLAPGQVADPNQPADPNQVTAPNQPAVTLTITGLGEDLPTDSSNLAVRAAELLRERFGVKDGVALHITKRIPIAAGMAGGSADAAGTLVACNELWGLGLSTEELLELGGELGSDVPFAMMGGFAHGVGRGEQLTPIESAIAHHWVLLTSSEGLSTPSVFREFDALMGYTRVPETLVADTTDLREALAAGNAAALPPLMINDLEQPALSLRPDLRETMRALRSRGHFALLSGSGPTIAVLASSADEADQLAEGFRELFPQHGVLRANGPVAAARVSDPAAHVEKTHVTDPPASLANDATAHVTEVKEEA
ncbi:MAG: 4-(cytidine 5'-diphospho)-2-C-methyl-D-erythritol kinase [Ancrocorticia sp.]